MEKSELKTPCYIVDTDQFACRLNYIRKVFCDEWRSSPVLGYSVKTNHLPELMTEAKTASMVAEVVSDDEYRHAMSCGFTPDQIIFNGPQKSADLLISALALGSLVNLDNFGEVEEIQRNIANLPVDRLRVGLRVNFDLEKQCPGETTAGEEVSRFGFCTENGDFEKALEALRQMGIRLSCLHMHYSTRTRSKAVFESLAEKAAELIRDFSLEDQIRYVDIGGGFFMGEGESTPGKPSMKEYAEAICKPLIKAVDPQKATLILEPGASLVAAAVRYRCRVINTREVRGVGIATTDGSLLHINPFMAKRTQAADVLYSSQASRELMQSQIVCGATCMENDRLLYMPDFPQLIPGDVLEFHCAGAYTMGFNNCFINVPPYVYMKSDGRYELVRGKNFEDMKRI